MTPGSRPGEDITKRPQGYWWKMGEKQVHSAIFGTVNYLDSIQAGRRGQMLSNLQLYSNRLASAFSPRNFQESADSGQKIRLNVVKSAIDTAVAHHATEKTRPMYLSKGGNSKLRERARLLTKFQLGQFLFMKRYQKFHQIFRDGAIFGLGIEKFYEDPLFPGRISSERVFPDELIFDIEETSTGKPRSIFQHKLVARELLEENPNFKRHKKAIAQATQARNPDEYTMGVSSPVSVIEGWHLPSGRDAKDGRHVICVSNATLFDEEYSFEEFPFDIFQWSDPLIGFTGISAAEDLMSLQLEINYIAQKIQKLMTLATSFVWKERGSGVSKLTNADWGQYEYSGKAPIFQTVTSASSEYFHHLDRLYQRAFEIVGITQMAAQGTQPNRIDSGEGLRVLNDIGAKRFLHVTQRVENYHLDAAERIYDVAQQMSDAGRSPVTLTPGDDGVDEIDFSRAYLERDKYIIQSYPAAMLPEEPAGQIEKLNQLSQAFPELRPYLPMAMEGAPDMEHIIRRVSAPVKCIEKMVDNIMAGEDYTAPFAGMDLQLARTIGTLQLNASYTDKSISRDRIVLLQRWLGQVDQLTQESMAAQMMQAGPGMGAVAPGATGMPPTIASAQPQLPSPQNLQ